MTALASEQVPSFLLITYTFMILNLSQIVVGLLLSACIGGLAYWRRSLTLGGWFGAIITGTATFGCGGWDWGLLLVLFFITSSLLSRYKERVKTARAGEKFEKGGRRDFGQAMANGGVAATLALVYALFGQPPALYFAYIGVLATVTADTWATELGVLSDHQPRLVTTGKIVETGTSGAITLWGSTAAALGGLTIGCAALLFAVVAQFLGRVGSVEWVMPVIGLCSGFAGALYDSYLGATVQASYVDNRGKLTERSFDDQGKQHRRVRGWGWMNNDAVNLISSIVGGCVAALGFWLT